MGRLGWLKKIKFYSFNNYFPQRFVETPFCGRIIDCQAVCGGEQDRTFQVLWDLCSHGPVCQRKKQRDWGGQRSFSYKGQGGTLFYTAPHSLWGEKLTKESVNKFLKSCWPGRSALQCDAGWETSSYQIILKHTRKCPKWRGYCDETLKLSHSRSLAVKHIFLPITISNTGQEVQLPSHSYSTNFCYMLTQFLTEDRGDGDRKNFQCLWKLVLLDLIWVIKEG